MDHHSRRCIGIAGSEALAWLLLLLLLTGMFSMVGCQNTEIDCLRSIKEALQDPLNKLSAWQFNNSGERDDFICSFPGVDCASSPPEPLGNRIMSISLSGMGLMGKFPEGIAYCSSLTSLNLSNNHLYGSIPSNLPELIPFVTSLDLSSNTFSGEIPPEIANCSELNILKLNNNRLTGRIPAQLVTLQRLNTFTVANNFLSGRIPLFSLSKFPPESYANNAGLCGNPLDPCAPKIEETLFMSGFFVGWAVFCALFFPIGLFTSVDKFVNNLVWRQGMRNPSQGTRNPRQRMRSPRLEPLPPPERLDNMISMAEIFATRISFLELSKATDNFSENNVISTEEMGTTYKAVFSNGWCLAAKRLCPTPHIEHEFLSEIITLGRLRHRNLVPLAGFCHEYDRFIVYKFMPAGSLHDYLFSSKGKAQFVEWPVRVSIAVGIAKGLAWLHQNRVVHRGISSKCILLDENFNPRISDFGKATTLNYAYSSWELPLNRDFLVLGSYEEDVYGFGMVLLELITGIEYNEINSSFDTNGDMSEQISHLLNEPRALGACVQSMVERGFDDEVSRFLGVASICVECDPGNWPSMEDVYQMLIGGRRVDAVNGFGNSLKNEIELAD